jgi:hypothetical protein
MLSYFNKISQIFCSNYLYIKFWIYYAYMLKNYVFVHSCISTICHNAMNDLNDRMYVIYVMLMGHKWFIAEWSFFLLVTVLFQNYTNRCCNLTFFHVPAPYDLGFHFRNCTGTFQNQTKTRVCICLLKRVDIFTL